MRWSLVFVNVTPARRRMVQEPKTVGFAMAAPQVLLTGFEPFGNHTSNISQTVALALQGHHRRRSPLVGDEVEFNVETQVLTVDEHGANTVASRLNEGEQWDVILHLGLCESCETARLEVRGSDQLSMRIPDNAGRQLHNAVVSGQGVQGAVVDPTCWPVDRFSTPFTVSKDAGKFICNESYHRTLLQLQALHNRPGLPVPCLFVHLPSSRKSSVVQANELVLDVIASLVKSPPVIDVVAGVVPSSDGRFLIAKRMNSREHGGTWEFPGGKVEPGESWSDATVREWKEELDVDVEPLHLLGTRSHVHEGHVYNVHAVLCRRVEDALEVTLNEHEEWHWWSPTERMERRWTGRDDELAAELR